MGVDRGDSATYGASAFAGTSQASPHVAGLAALVLEQFPGLTPLEVASYLKTNADPQGTVPNNTWGFGLAKLPLLAPGTPTGLSAVKGDRQATVSWTAPSADGGSSITGYTVTSNPGAQTAAVGSSTLSATVTALTNGTSYNFTVTATNAIGTSASSTSSNAVTPINEVPVITAAAGLTTDEGTTLNMVVATFTDTEASDTHTATIDWGDGGGTDVGTVSESSGSGSVTGVHAYVDNGSYTVTVTVTDSSAGAASVALSVTVNNVAPVVNAGPDLTVEAGTFELTEPAFTDPGSGDTHTVNIDWGDGTTENKTAIAGSHQYNQAGTYTLTFTVTDDDGGSGSDSMQLQVTTPPEAPTSISAVAGDGQATVSWTAPSADGGSAITGYTVTSSPGAQNAAVGASTLNTAVTGLTNGASYTFTVTAANAIGTSASSTPSNVVTPNSAAPAITAAADVTTNEGATLNMVVITFTDTEPSDTHTATIDWGDGGGTDAGAVSESSGSGSVTGVHAYADNGSYIVTVTVTDSSAGVASGTLIVTVNNVAPVVNVGPNQTVGAGAFQLTQPTFTDQGAADTHTVTIDWGDGTTENKTAIAGSHQYDAVGTYTLIFSVTDDDGGVGTGSMQLQVTSAPATVNIPSVEAWGLLALGAVLMILVVRTARRRQSGHAWRSEL